MVIVIKNANLKQMNRYTEIFRSVILSWSYYIVIDNYEVRSVNISSTIFGFAGETKQPFTKIEGESEDT